VSVLQQLPHHRTANDRHQYIYSVFQSESAIMREKKIKVFPPQAQAGPWGSGRLRLRIFWTFGIVKVVRSSPLRTGHLYIQEFSWYSFLEAESTPEHMVPSVASEKIPSDTTGDRSQDPPTSSAVNTGEKSCIETNICC
jgi:hypothetical protein